MAHNNTYISGTPSYIPDLCRLPVVLAVLLLTQLLVVIYVLSQNSIAQFNWQQLSLLSLYNQWISMLSVAGLCFLRHRFNELPVPVATAGCLFWVALVVLLANTAAQWINRGQQWQHWSFLWLLRDEIIYQVLAGIALRYLYVLRLWRREQAATHSARLDALYARIRPHFLFNAMNTIASLIGYAPQQAEEAVEDLSALMRASLSDRGRLSDWQHELELTKAYCRIEQQRLGDRLVLNWSVDAVPREFKLPPLVLQPLLENAIYHGVENCESGGEVNVRAEIINSEHQRDVHIQIDNPCPESSGEAAGLVRKAHRHNGIALDNIRARLGSLYLHPKTLQPMAHLVNEQRGERYFVRLTIPLDDGSADSRAQ